MRKHIYEHRQICQESEKQLALVSSILKQRFNSLGINMPTSILYSRWKTCPIMSDFMEFIKQEAKNSGKNYATSSKIPTCAPDGHFNIPGGHERGAVKRKFILHTLRLQYREHTF